MKRSPGYYFVRVRAFTLVDILVTIAVMAIVIAVAAPSFTPDDRARLIGAVNMMVADIEYAQSLSLSAPSNHALVRFGDDGASYWVAYESDPETPATMPGAAGDPFLVQFGVDRASLLFDVSFTTVGVTDSKLVFDEFARLATLDEARITLTNAGGSMEIVISSATGSVRIE